MMKESHSQSQLYALWPLLMSDEEGFQLEHGCSVLFDLFHNCSSVKGRFKDYYRFGKVRSCMPYWNDFFLCLRLKLETDQPVAQSKWMKQRQASLQQRFGLAAENPESPTIGVIWDSQ